MKKITVLIVGITLLVIAAFLIKHARNLGFNQGYAPTQPIAFSHKLHAGDQKLQCLYCHFAADKGRHAGIPPTELCLNCHKYIQTQSPEIAKIKKAVDTKTPVKWVKVHHLPDFAYFNHSQHVNVAGLACQKCHGEVEKMQVLKQQETLSMGWCIECHRDNQIAPPNDHKNAGAGDCAKCHY